jgi:hypothetical protein
LTAGRARLSTRLAALAAGTATLAHSALALTALALAHAALALTALSLTALALTLTALALAHSLVALSALPALLSSKTLLLTRPIRLLIGHINFPRPRIW